MCPCVTHGSVGTLRSIQRDDPSGVHTGTPWRQALRGSTQPCLGRAWGRQPGDMMFELNLEGQRRIKQKKTGVR